MKRIVLVLMGAMLLVVLGACGGDAEKEEVLRVHEDFHNLVEGVDERGYEAELFLNDYIFQTISDERFEEDKAEFEEYVEDLRVNLDKVEEPTTEKGKEYYGLSKDVVVAMADSLDGLLDVPPLDNEDELYEFQEVIVNKIKDLEGKTEDLESYQDELKKEDEDYKEAFKSEDTEQE